MNLVVLFFHVITYHLLCTIYSSLAADLPIHKSTNMKKFVYGPLSELLCIYVNNASMTWLVNVPKYCLVVELWGLWCEWFINESKPEDITISLQYTLIISRELCLHLPNIKRKRTNCPKKGNEWNIVRWPTIRYQDIWGE